jgi:Yip1 domain
MEHKAWSIDGGLPTADSAEVSEFTRLFGFYKPNVAMRDIVLHPACIVPLMLTCIASMAYLVTASPQLASQGNRALQETAGIAVNVCVRTLLSAGLLTLYASAVSHAPVQFRQVFAVVSYARMPGVVFTVLAIILILMRRASGLPDSHPLNPMLTSLAVFLDPATTSPFFYTLARSVDCVVFWELSLMAVGLKLASRLSSAAANGAVVILWVLTSLAQAAWAQSLAH